MAHSFQLQFNFSICSRPTLEVMGWERVHVDYLSPFFLIRTFLRFTLTFVSFSNALFAKLRKSVFTSTSLRKFGAHHDFVRISLRTAYRLHWGTPFKRRWYKWHFLLSTGWYSINDIFLSPSQSYDCRCTQGISRRLCVLKCLNDRQTYHSRVRSRS